MTHSFPTRRSSDLQAQRDNGTVTLTPDGLTGVSTVTEQRSDLRLEYKEKSVLVGMIGGKTEANDWTFDYGLARSHNEVVEPNQLWQFRGNPRTVDFEIGRASCRERVWQYG